MNRRFGLLFVAIAVVSGCDSTGPTRDFPRTGWAPSHFPNTDQQRAFNASRTALQQWFRIDRSDPGAGLLTTFPIEDTEKGDTGRIRDTAVHYANQIRRRAAVRIRSGDGGSTVECVVIKERMDTSDHRAMGRNRQFEDVNNQTQIQSEAATSGEQNAVWTDVGRDRGMERDILRVIREQLGAASQPGEDRAPTAPPA